MRRLVLIIVTLLASVSLLTGADARTRRALQVNPFVGTDYTGNTYPGAQMPFGMVQLSPDNGLPGWDRIAGYFYPDSTIAGFSHTHLLGTGAGDMYDISYMPATMPLRQAEAPLGLHSRFSHSSEEAHAGYYAVTLQDYDIRVELTATERVGVQRYTRRSSSAPLLVFLNLGKAMNWDATEATYVEQVDSVTIQGYRYSTGWARHQRVYFATRFSRPFSRMQQSGGEGSQRDSLTCFTFPALIDTLEVFTAISPTSMQAALTNLGAEAPTNGFDTYLSHAEQCWDETLGVLDVEGSATDERIFYTALYHSLLCPTLYCDAPSASSSLTYQTFSLWDTFRAQHPLLTLIQPQRVSDMVRSLVDFGEQQGRLPVWNMWGSETDMMIGYHAVPVIADACIKGLITDSLARRALALSITTADLNIVRGGVSTPSASIPSAPALGFIPMHHRDLGGNDWSLSRTLEYAYDDACIARLAQTLSDTAAADDFRQRAQNFRNLWNPATGFFQPRDSMGHWQSDFNPAAFTPYICESNAWPYLFNVQHDIPALVQLLGGPDGMSHRLDQLFTAADEDELPIFSTGKIGQYVHGNEPSHHIAYLYHAAGQAHRTQELVARIRQEMYADTPAGLCGNEDCGQMSAWYVFSALGFYPVDPCGGDYWIGTPLFSRATLSLPNNRTFTVRTEGTGPYIRSVVLNGTCLPSYIITHQQIMAGGTLTFQMSETPCPAWYPEAR